MTKEEVLQKVNEFCTEKQYTSATLTDVFKDKFADHFQKANAEGDINDESVIANLKFNLSTAFSSASELATVKANEFVTKENAYKSQIAELQKQIKTPVVTPQPAELPDDVKNQLKELQDFKDEKTRKEKLSNIMALAKANIRKDLHASFDKYAEGFSVSLDKEDKAQADELHAKFQSIMAQSIGDIKPKAPVQTQKQEEEYIASIPKVQVS